MNIFIALWVIAGSSLITSYSQLPGNSNQEKYPKNIILLIGDGMGLAQVQAAMGASDEPLNIERCEQVGLIKTSSSSDYITDSAAGATAFACGVKTFNGAIGVDADSSNVKSILEFAEAAGLATGLVASSTITHATPASFIAHNVSRGNHEAIALDFLETDIDVFMGGGLKYFNDRKDQADLLEQLRNKNYQIVLNADDLSSVKEGKIAGLLHEKNFKSLIKGRDDVLIKSSDKAIEILSKDEDGFFLMIEGSQIDWGGHDKDIKYVVTELLEFDIIVGKALDFAEKDGNTLVIITADHETGGLTVFGNDVMNSNDATKFSSSGHSAIMVPVYASGPQADKFTGIYENNALFNKMMTALNLRQD